MDIKNAKSLNQTQGYIMIGEPKIHNGIKDWTNGLSLSNDNIKDFDKLGKLKPCVNTEIMFYEAKTISLFLKILIQYN